MADIPARGLDKEVVARLEARARAATAERQQLFTEIDRLFEGRSFSDSTELIRQDRDR